MSTPSFYTPVREGGTSEYDRSCINCRAPYDAHTNGQCPPSEDSLLNAEQRAEAQRLRHARPAVLVGTNVIADEKLRLAWYEEVSASIKALGFKDQNAVAEFCDVAGVPD